MLEHLPAVNASLNGIAFCLLIAGLIAIKRKNIDLHKRCMLAALGFSAAFLTCYVIYHANKKGVTTPFPGTGIWRTIYLLVLWPHIVLAAIVLPMILITANHALRSRFDKHKRIARITLPIWLYVSFTGVVVYVMLYRIPWNG